MPQCIENLYFAHYLFLVGGRTSDYLHPNGEIKHKKSGLTMPRQLVNNQKGIFLVSFNDLC